MAAEDVRTVRVAMAANAVIALAKLVAAVLTGSKALMAEFAHSVADTMDQVFLLVSLSRGDRDPDEAHPFGFGKERFFWAFLAALAIFLVGAIFSIGQGVLFLVIGEAGPASFLIGYVVLSISLVAELVSWRRAYVQTRGEAQAAGMGFRQFARTSPDPTVKTVLLEDSAAVLGIVFAFVGLALDQLTGSRIYDPIASILIGLVLGYVAYGLGRDTKNLLIGASARPEDRDRIKAVIEGHPEVGRVVQLLTMYVGPDSLLVAARVDLRPGPSGEEIEELADRIEDDLRREVPAVGEVFLDPTPGGRRADVGGGSDVGEAH
jgi:cation diffusion facilitator family transporter